MRVRARYTKSGKLRFISAIDLGRVWERSLRLADLPIVAVGEDQEVGPARVVACTDPGATYVVEGRLDRLTEAQASSPTICQAYENATFIYRAVPRGGTGYVLCLRALNP